MYIIGERWFEGRVQTALYNLGIVIWLFSEIMIFIINGKRKSTDKKGVKSSDRYSVYIIILGSVFSFILAVWGIQFLQADIAGVFAWSGILVLYAGIIFRGYSVWTLGRYFTVTVEIKESHRIIKTGPYAYIRHPAYTGSILSLLGMQIGARSLIGLFTVIPIIILMYGYRINMEEKALLDSLGKEYADYKKRTKKLVPFIY